VSESASTSLRWDAVWAMVGSLAQAAAQLVLMVVLTRILTAQAVGEYALALAIAAPLNVFADRALRTLQATATSQDWPLWHYVWYRLGLGACAVLITVLLLAAWPLDFKGNCVVLLVGLARVMEGITQTLYGRLEQYRRMRQVGQSQAVRAVLSLACSTAVLGLTRRLDWALAASLVLSVIVFQGWDLRRIQELSVVRSAVVTTTSSHAAGRSGSVEWWRLTRLVLPLGISTFLVALTASLPRLYLSRCVNEQTLAVFAVLCYLCFPATLMVSAMMQAAMPRLAELHRLDSGRYRQLCWRLFVAAGVTAVLNCLVVGAAGPRLLAVTFGQVYAASAQQLEWIAIASGVGYLATVPATALVAQRLFRLTLTSCSLACLVCLVSGAVLIPRYALAGATAVMLLTSGVHLVSSSAGWWWASRRPAWS